MPGTKVAALVLAEAPAPWKALGFSVVDGVAQLGRTALRFGTPTERGGLSGWVLSGDGPTCPEDVDGIPTTWVAEEEGRPGEHPNGVTAAEHVVVSSPDADRTFAALEAAGMALRRESTRRLGDREIRQGFFRHGECIVEVIAPTAADGDGPSTLWGLTVVVADLDACAALLGDRLGPVQAAVQPGRRIATARPDGSRTPLAFMDVAA